MGVRIPLFLREAEYERPINKSGHNMSYIKDSYQELVEKVTWPTWKELQSSAVVVMVASLIFALVILAMDLSFENIMKAIYGLLY